MHPLGTLTLISVVSQANVITTLLKEPVIAAPTLQVHKRAVEMGFLFLYTVSLQFD